MIRKHYTWISEGGGSPQGTANVNYYHVDEHSYYWTNIEMLLNWLKYAENSRPINVVQFLQEGLENTLKNGYDIRPTPPQEATPSTGELEIRESLLRRIDVLENELAALKQASRPTYTGDSKDKEEDQFIQKHMKIIMGKMLDIMIDSHFKPMFDSLESASIKYFLETGTINGGFRNRLQKFAMDFAEKWHNRAASTLTQDAAADVKEAAEEVMKLNFYSWKQDGMKENRKDVPPEDVFVLRQDVLELLAGVAFGGKSDAVEFADWLKSFEALSKENGEWVLESKISSEKLYKSFKSKQKE